jgi:phosphomannomutase
VRTKFAGSKVLRTAVDEANVVAAMKSAGSTIGGEGNGGVIWPKVCWVHLRASNTEPIIRLISEAANDAAANALADRVAKAAGLP